MEWFVVGLFIWYRRFFWFFRCWINLVVVSSVDFEILVSGEEVGISARSLVMVRLNICSVVIIFGISLGILDLGGILFFLMVSLILVINWIRLFLRSCCALGLNVNWSWLLSWMFLKFLWKFSIILVDRWLVVVFIFVSVGRNVRGMVNRKWFIKLCLWFIFVLSFVTLSNCVEFNMLKGVLVGMILFFLVE